MSTNGTTPTELSLEERLHITKYSRKECIAAINGETLPYALGDPVHRLCVIRYDNVFGTALRGMLPVFTRALNARSIMSNVVPTRESPEDIPYCIWHPETGSEETYRGLARRYPQTKYQVGRACAVAGYTNLYQELDILPDAHIAEEARECGNTEIVDLIMSQPLKYIVMNGYKLSWNTEAPDQVRLNGETCVSWMLDVKQDIRNPMGSMYERNGEFHLDCIFDDLGFQESMFNITEDQHIDEHESDGNMARLLPTRLEVQLLSSPLPLELPTVQKDLLIACAAYYGDVDRYARLRRPAWVHGCWDI